MLISCFDVYYVLELVLNDLKYEGADLVRFAFPRKPFYELSDDSKLLVSLKIMKISTLLLAFTCCKNNQPETNKTLPVATEPTPVTVTNLPFLPSNWPKNDLSMAIFRWYSLPRFRHHQLMPVGTTCSLSKCSGSIISRSVNYHSMIFRKIKHLLKMLKRGMGYEISLPLPNLPFSHDILKNGIELGT